ncbi:elongation factor G [Leptolyngbyaceae cyanobacterium CCMR0082]|uniref:Elongation factor G n=1 Tax=Adonisia turfae CCMR0082 TaxID=2304604 RepID=A0A6M0SCC4_9CYAN|nr:elongation factor G [Adonisia turfae]MDV3352533.1 elongation factor G [Leptothoe sp. LEGE 181152]NEZ66129.1 elongation factor G [Adonisia turfae CCMR0082]
MAKAAVSRSRNVAIVGPYSSGKTTLLESLLSVTDTISRKGSIPEGNTIGDHTPEARNRQMTVETNAACTEYGGIRFTFLDCPGSIELLQEPLHILMGVDAAIVVCEPDPSRVLTVSPLLHFLDKWEIPHVLWLNKMDRASAPFSDVLEALKSVSSRPLVPHQYPIGAGADLVGFIDLVSEQAYHYHAGAAADPVPLPQELAVEEAIARTEMLETLADFDDHLLEELLEEIDPPEDEIIQDLKMELGADLVVPVFVGVASKDYGVRPLLDALVRETPEPQVTAERRGIDLNSTEPLVQILKTYYSPQGGKLSLARLWRGTLKDGANLGLDRMGGLYSLMGSQQQALSAAEAGSVVAIARLEHARTGDTLTTAENSDETLPIADILPAVYSLAIAPEKRDDEVKLSGALNKLVDEDPALHWEQHGDTHEVILWGQGDVHLKIAMDWLRRKYNLSMVTHVPQVAYKETIRNAKEDIRGRYKHQTGGHGQFGDIYIDIQPLPRGEGFKFAEKIVGGVVPKQYIPSVETGVREFLKQGPLGFPVVDVSVTLKNGSYHHVDSSDQAFKQAARIAMQTGLPECKPALLEPIASLSISVPNRFTSNVLTLISGRRGQVMGYTNKANWPGWDEVSAQLPVAEMQTLILELRSLSMGVGFFSWQYDHLNTVPERLKEKIVAEASNHK